MCPVSGKGDQSLSTPKLSRLLGKKEVREFTSKAAGRFTLRAVGRGAYLASGKGNQKSSSQNSSRSSCEGEGVIALNAAEAYVATDEKDWRLSTLEPSKSPCEE